MDMTLFEVDEAANRIRDEVDPEANIIFGSTFDENLEGKMRVSVVATGIDSGPTAVPRPAPLSLVSDRSRRAMRDGHEAPARAAETAALETPEASRGVTARAALTSPTEPPVASERDREVDRKTPGPATDDGTAEVEGSENRVADQAGEQISPAPRTSVKLPPLRTPTGPSAAGGAASSGDAPFIARPPAMPVSRQSKRGKPTNSSTEAALVDGDSAQPKPKRLGASLFARVTGAGRAKSAENAPPPTPPKTKHDQAAEPAQPKLGGLDPADRIKTSRSEEEDLLEIPAFLRRRAN
jgi:cell division protein FtsZ